MSSFILGDVLNCVYIVKVEAIHGPLFVLNNYGSSGENANKLFCTLPQKIISQRITPIISRRMPLFWCRLRAFYIAMEDHSNINLTYYATLNVSPRSFVPYNTCWPVIYDKVSQNFLSVHFLV